MEPEAMESWPPASRRRRVLAVFLDFLLLGAPIAVLLWGVGSAFPWIHRAWFPLQLLFFLLIEALLIGLVRFSPGRGALGIATRSRPWSPIEPDAPSGTPVVDPRLLAHERWWTLLLGVLLVMDGAKLVVRWTQWSRTMPFFGTLLEGPAAASLQVLLGALEMAAGVGLLRLRRWAAWAGMAYSVIVLTSFAASGHVVPEYVEREYTARHAYMGREVGPEQMRMAQRFVPAATNGIGVVMLAWLVIVAAHLRSRRRTP